jgi:putative phosphoesterase
MPTNSKVKKTVHIALLSDVHANWQALEAVLKDIKKEKADEIWCLGDLLGYGPDPQKVTEAIKARAKYCIMGNCDLEILEFPGKKKIWKAQKDPSKYASAAWTYRNFPARLRPFIRNLPSTRAIKKEGKKFLLVHGSPDKIDESLRRDTPRERFAQLAKKVDAQVVLCGHTHIFFDKTIDNVRFINPGSVGRPFDGDKRASYALLRLKNGKLSVKNRRIRFDVGKVVRKMGREKFPREILRAVSRGISFDQAKDELYAALSKKDILDGVIALAGSCGYEKGHSHQVTKVTLKLFDKLKGLHRLGPRQRLLLQSASLLHDIGWVKGCSRHHKTARDMILKSFRLPLNRAEKLMVALIARYHRRALPEDTHKYYGELPERKKIELKKLASLLRLADGLDREHVNSVKDLRCRVRPRQVIVRITSGRFSETEKEAALHKADLFKDTFHRKVNIIVGETNEK